MAHSYKGKVIFMPTIQLINDSSSTMTSVSNIFIDEFMPEANGEFVKVYLYLLRSLSNHSCECTISAIADKLEHTEKDVTRALKYWERMGLLKLEFNSSKKLSAVHVLNCQSRQAENPATAPAAPMAAAQAQGAMAPAAAPMAAAQAQGAMAPAAAVAQPQVVSAPAATAPTSSGLSLETIPVPPEAPVDELPNRLIAYTVPPVVTSADKPARKEYSLNEIKEFQKDESVSELLFLVETYLKRPLSSSDTNTVLFWYDQLHFPTDLIVYLMEYCISKGHSSMRYMDKVALAWKDSNISTVEQAKEQAAIHSQVYYGVMKAFGITGRSLVDGETRLIKKWTKEFGFDMELVLEACSRTMTAIHQPSFEYTDKILAEWHKNHVHTLNDIKTLDQSYQKNKKTSSSTTTSDTPKRNKFNNFNQRDYDYDQLEKILLTTSVQ